MEQWEKLFQDMIEIDPKGARMVVDINFRYLRDLDMVSARNVISEIAGMLRFRHPEAYQEFELWFDIGHKLILEDQEKAQHRAEVIQFKRKA